MSDPLTEPLAPKQEPYHLRSDPTVEARQLALMRDMQRLQDASDSSKAAPAPPSTAR